MAMNRYGEYLKALKHPFKKLAKLEFLQPDDSVAFALDNNDKRGYNGRHHSSAFLQSGSLSVNLQNGQRRQASVTLSNLDGAFDYAVNNIWFGQRVRLSMGLVLPDGSEFYLPQGVFYIKSPKSDIQPNLRQITYELSDKWSHLDGSLFGTLASAYQVPTMTDGKKTNIFQAMQKILHLSRFNPEKKMAPLSEAIDPVPPVFTNYYNGKTYKLQTGGRAQMTDVPYTMTVGADNGSYAGVLLELNEALAGMIGYDQTGALRVEASQEDISDADKPVLWTFTPENSQLLSLSETQQNTAIYNDILVVGQKLTGYEVYGRATNFDPSSPTNVNRIGRKTLYMAKSNYWNAEQCVDLASWTLKRQSVLSRSISISSTQMFHLIENMLIAVKRPDKPGNPMEKHVIQSFTLPIGETGAMSIEAISVEDYPLIATTGSWVDESEAKEKETSE